MSIWKINGIDFDELGAENLSVETVSQDIDRVTFDAKSYAIDAAPPWPYKTPATITRDGKPWFSGIVLNPSGEITGDNDFQTVEVAGPWWWLTQIDFRTNWQGVGYPYPRGILFMDEYGESFTTGEQIIEALTYALAIAGDAEPFQIGRISGGPTPPWKEVASIMCSEVVRECLRWMPDCVAFFDYSTTPPTFNVKRRSECKAVSFPVAGRENLRIKFRADLQLPSVLIIYEQKETSDGKSTINPIRDLYPPTATGTEPGCLCQVLPLSGYGTTYQKQPVETRDIPSSDGEDSVMLDFWKKNVAALGKINIENLEWINFDISVDDGQTDFRGNPITYTITAVPRQLTKGAVTKWMNDADSNLKSARATAGVELFYIGDSSQADYKAAMKYFGGEGIEFSKTFSIPITVTNATTQTYEGLTGITLPEPVPSNMAQWLYESCADPKFEGELSILQQEVSGLAVLGNLLNLTGGAAGWTTMNELIQSCRQTIATGQTVFRFGPPRHLGPQDLLELFRAARQHKPSENAGQRTDADNTASGITTLDATADVPPPTNGGGATKKRPPYPWSPVEGMSDGEPDGTITLNQNSFLYDTSSAKLTIQFIDETFTPSIGQMIYLHIPLHADLSINTDDGGAEMVQDDMGVLDGIFPAKINSDDPANPYQQDLYQKIMQFVDPSDDRDGDLFVTTGGTLIKIVQLCKTHLKMVGGNVPNQAIFGSMLIPAGGDTQ